MFNNLLELIEKMPTEQDCRDYFAKQRWIDGKPYCVHCGSGKVYSIHGGKRYECGEKLCGKRFSVTCGTIFHGSKIGLKKWFMAVYLCSNSKKGISSHQLAKHIGTTQKTSWFMMHRIRKINEIAASQNMQSTVQADEWYCGGLEKNKHAKKRDRKKKPAVFGMIDKQWGVKAVVMPDVSKELVNEQLEKNVVPGTTIVTDAFSIYRGVAENYNHITISHNEGEFKNEQGYHINSIENFWSHLSRSIIGVHHWVSLAHLQRYVDNTAFKYNTRKMTDANRFVLTLQGAEKRLDYKTLIGKK